MQKRTTPLAYFLLGSCALLLIAASSVIGDYVVKGGTLKVTNEAGDTIYFEADQSTLEHNGNAVYSAADATASSAGAGDAGKLGLLDGAGKFDSSMLPDLGASDFSDLTGSATDAQVDNDITASNYLPLTGGTLTGSLTAPYASTIKSGILTANNYAVVNSASGYDPFVLFQSEGDTKWKIQDNSGFGISRPDNTEDFNVNATTGDTTVRNGDLDVTVGDVTIGGGIEVDGAGVFNDTLDVAGDATVDGGTLYVDSTSNQVWIQGAVGQFVVKDTDAAVGEKTWLFLSGSGVFNIKARNDDGSYTAGKHATLFKSDGGIVMPKYTSAPSSPEAGEVYYNTTTNKLQCYNGSTWNNLF